MALKPDRVEHLTDLSFFMNETGERGVIVIHNTTGSGASMDDAAATVEIPDTAAEASGDPAGLLLNDVVNLDLTRQHLNYHQDEVQQGGKVLLLRRGTVVTDKYSGTPEAGEPAYFWIGGVLVADSDKLANNSPTQVGRFLSKPNSDGYVKVEINIV
jgi:hypothetical protein